MGSNAFWKQKERKVAREYFGCERNALDGSHQADCENDTFVVEMFNAAFPKYLREAIKHLSQGDAAHSLVKVQPKKMLDELSQAVSVCPKNKTPVLVWSEKGKRIENSLLIIKMFDFVDLYGVKTIGSHMLVWTDPESDLDDLVLMNLKDFYNRYLA